MREHPSPLPDWAVVFVRQFVVLSAAFVAALHATTAAAGDVSPAREVDRSYYSTAVAGTEHMEIYLPAGYDDGRRYPVIYALHGLPSDDNAYRRLGVTAFGRAAEQAGHPAIVVAPQGSRPGDRDPEWLDWGPGRNWESMVAIGVVRRIDRDFRTIPDRRARALIGISAGGYGAADIGIHNLKTFSVIQSWSGYFYATNPAGTGPMDLGSPQADAAANVHTYARKLRRSFQRFPTSFAFYVGNQDDRFLRDNRRFDRQLTRNGVSHSFSVYPGTHSSTLWQAHMDDWVGRAVRTLTAAH